MEYTVMSVNKKPLSTIVVDVQDFGDGIVREYRCDITARKDGRFESWYCERGSLRARAGYGDNTLFLFDTYEEACRHAAKWAKRARMMP